jgi:hypothetical protein
MARTSSLWFAMVAQHVLSGGLYALAASPSSAFIKPSTFTAPGAFPTSAFHKYYNNPTQTSAQVQPVITDPVTVRQNHVPFPVG